MILIEGDKKTVNVTVLEEKDEGFTGVSDELTKQELINKLIDEGILEDGERVYREESE